MLLFPCDLLAQDKVLRTVADYKADILFEQGIEKYQATEFIDAIEIFEQVVALQLNKKGDYSEPLSKSYNSIGLCYLNLQDYNKALFYFQRAISILEKVLGREVPDYAVCSSNIGLCLFYLGDYSKALEYHLNALKIREKVFGKDHPDYVANLSNIGDCYRELGFFAEALEYHQQALWGHEKLYGRNNNIYYARLGNIGHYYRNLGDYSMALDCYNRALQICEGIYGQNSDYINLLNDIGSCYIRLGDYSRALEYHQQAINVAEKVSGKNNVDYVRCLNFIGICYRLLGDSSRALDYQLQALEIEKRIKGEGDTFTLNCIEMCYQDMGNTIMALEFIQQALAIEEKQMGKEHPYYAELLCNVASCYVQCGDFTEAIENYQESLSIIERTVGKKHPSYSTILRNLGICYYYLHDVEKATRCLQSYYETETEYIARTFSTLTEAQRSIFWEQDNRFFLDAIYEMCVQLSTSNMNRTAYNVALFSKGLLLNTEIEIRTTILESGDDELIQMLNELQESRSRLDRINNNALGKKSEIDSLNNVIEKRQLLLMARCPDYERYYRNLSLKWKDVQTSIGKKDIAIEFETYTHKDTTFYIALTLKPDYSEPHVIALFNSEDLKRFNPKQYYNSVTLTGLIWGNLSNEINGVDNVYFSPAGELNNIGIEYLLDADGKHLVSDKRNYYRLTSTREIVKKQSQNRIKEAILYGGIRYDISPESKVKDNELESDRLTLTANRTHINPDSLAVSRKGWSYLPGSKEEVEAIFSTLSKKKIISELYESEKGTEESFKALSNRRQDVIHIATHGFYWSESNSQKEARNRGLESFLFMQEGMGKVPKEDKALTRSGLLFAGAQNAFEGKRIPPDVEDGILTAKEISRMDLKGTNLVVLSACQTGLGEITGDGVLGLQRGFKKAGVQSIIMSLWQVDDVATRILMTRFYENLSKGKSKYDSFHEARKYLSTHEFDGRFFNTPYYYAAFVLLDAI